MRVSLKVSGVMPESKLFFQRTFTAHATGILHSSVKTESYEPGFKAESMIKLSMALSQNFACLGAVCIACSGWHFQNPAVVVKPRSL